MTQPPSTLRVLCADDHALVREGIASMVDAEPGLRVVAEASDGREAVEKFLEFRPDVTLMDLKMAVMNGLDAIAAIRRSAKDAKIIVLTTYRGDVAAQRALSTGAAGYLLKSDVRRDLVDTIRAVHAGQTRISASVVEALSDQRLFEALSEREVAILQQIARGKANREIGQALFITEGTVKNHVKSILSKLNANDRTHAVMLGLERGIIGI